VAGQERFSGPGLATYAQGADAAVIFCDLTNYSSLYRELRLARPDLPVVFMGSKADCQYQRVTAEQTNDWVRRCRLAYPAVSFQYYKVSAKTGHNGLTPLLYLARELTGAELTLA
jgi:Ras family